MIKILYSSATATSAISSGTPIKWDFFTGRKKVYNHFTTFKLSPDMVCHKKTAALPFVCKFALEGKGLIKFCPLRIIITIGLRWEEMILEQIIKQIIECENKEYDEFMEYQEKRILELKELQKRKKRGEDIDLSSVLSGLRKSGILDSKNNIAMPYLAVLGKER